MNPEFDSPQERLRRERYTDEAFEFVIGGFAHVVSPRDRYGDRGGMVAHRGVLHPAEYVDLGRLLPAVEAKLGFTREECHSVYRQGSIPRAQRELRARIDARFLELANNGTNMTLLARVLGFKVDRTRRCNIMRYALARARQLKEAA